jgi:uncharacterized OsmC-like protein
VPSCSTKSYKIACGKGSYSREEHGSPVGAEAAEGEVAQRAEFFAHNAAGAGSQTDAPISCSADIGRAVCEAQAHSGVGGPGTAACSGDLLLGALAACAQATCQMVAEAMGMETERIEVEVEGDLDLAGTLGVSKDVPVGFERIRTRFNVVAPEATQEQLDALQRKTEQYCVVLQTLVWPPELETEWA